MSNDGLRILFALHSRVEWGGAEAHLLRVASHLAARGHSPIIVSNVSELIRRGAEAGLETAASPWPGSVPTRTGRVLRWAFLAPPLILSLLAQIKRFRPDVIHAHSPLDHIIFSLTRPLHRRPVMWTSHADVMRSLLGGKRVMRALYALAARGVDLIVCVSQTEQAALQKHLSGAKGRQPRVIHLPPGLAGLGRQKSDEKKRGDSVVVGSVGRLDAGKGADLILRAFAGLESDLPATQLWFVGSGSREDDLKQLARTLDLEHRVRFLGYREDPAPLLAAMDIFVLASDAEGFPLSVAEAMASGRAIVASEVGDVPHLITAGKEGILFPAGDGEALRDAIETLAGDPELRREMGERARKRAEGLMGSDDVAGSLLSLYRELVAEGGSRG